MNTHFGCTFDEKELAGHVAFIKAPLAHKNNQMALKALGAAIYDGWTEETENVEPPSKRQKLFVGEDSFKDVLSYLKEEEQRRKAEARSAAKVAKEEEQRR